MTWAAWLGAGKGITTMEQLDLFSAKAAPTPGKETLRDLFYRTNWHGWNNQFQHLANGVVLLLHNPIRPQIFYHSRKR